MELQMDIFIVAEQNGKKRLLTMAILYCGSVY